MKGTVVVPFLPFVFRLQIYCILFLKANFNGHTILTGFILGSAYFCDMTFILLAILFYVLFKFITGFVWPVYKGIRQVKEQMRQMSADQPGPDYRNEATGSATRVSVDTGNRTAPRGTVDKSDYIDFEEL
jgi:hypothetical protein